MKLLLYIFITVALLFSDSIKASSQSIMFDHIDMRSGLSNLTINSIYQDENDIIWIATRDGLNRFNQGHIDIFRPVAGDTLGLYGNNIQSICGDRNGHLYLQCIWGIVQYDQHSQQFRKVVTRQIVNISYGRKNLWACSANAIFTYDSENNKLDKYTEFFNNERLTCIKESKNGLLYAGTRNGLVLIEKNKASKKIIPGIEVICIYEDTKSNIWIGTLESGLYKLDTSGEITVYKHDSNDRKTISSNYVRSICEDNLGNYWIGTSTGLNRLDSNTDRFINYTHSETDINSISSSSVWNIMKDHQGTLWIGTFYGGVNVFNPEYLFSNYYKSDEKELSYPVVGKIIEDEDNNLWIATDGGGLNYLDRRTHSFTHFKHQAAINTLSSNIIKDIWLDKGKNTLWLGTHLGGLCEFNIKTRQVKRYSFSKRTGAGSDDIRSIEYYDGKLYLGTKNSVVVFDMETYQTTPLIANFDSESRQIWDMMIDSDKMLWYSTSFAIFRYDLKSGKQQKYVYDFDKPDYLGENYQNTFFEDKEGNIWLGSAGSGLFLYHPESDSFEVFNTKNSQIIGDYIINLHQSKMGFLLIATNKGFSRFGLKEGQFYNHFVQDISPLSAINERGLHVTRGGEIVIGGFNGMIILNEKELDFKKKAFKINFTNLWINNQVISPDDKTKILSDALIYTKGITLNHYHTSLAIEFTVSNYIKLLKGSIEYKLEGFDEDWINVREGNKISYTNLSPGKYTLKVRSSDSMAKHSLDIIVKPPFYATWTAYILYFIILFALVFYFLRNYITQIKLKTSLEYAHKEKVRTDELNQAKLRFFTNVSHELRTPVTLMLSQIDLLTENKDINRYVQKKLSSIMKNVRKMQDLINEILDFRKQEQGFLIPKVQYIDIIRFTREIYHSFKEYALAKHIRLSFTHEEESIELWFDPVLIEKVFNNLLSNAFKFTAEKGEIDIVIRKSADTVDITFRDNGIGIPADQQMHIFDHFFQVETGKYYQGTGIGLTLAKGIVESHGGKISVKSMEGKGSEFTVNLLLHSGHLEIENYTKEIGNYPSDHSPQDVAEESFSENDALVAHPDSLHRLKILIVEDNRELLDILVSLFAPIYNVFTAENGESGLEIAAKEQPDIILSDVMMPKMSGTELCRKIKTNLETAHIPVVLLTARSAIEHTIEGFTTGADDYIVKPFNNKLLIARCNSLINNRRAIQVMFSRNTEIKTDMLAMSAVDQELLDKAIEIVEANLLNSQFDVDMFADKLNLGRTNLFIKLKGIAGQTPSEFIMSIRLKKGQLLLTNNPELNISDIAFQTGFSESAYFVKCFKNAFGKTPLQFRKDKSNKG